MANPRATIGFCMEVSAATRANNGGVTTRSIASTRTRPGVARITVARSQSTIAPSIAIVAARRRPRLTIAAVRAAAHRS